jgi:hypothetical protein
MSKQRGPRAQAVMDSMLDRVPNLQTARRQRIAEAEIEKTMAYQMAVAHDAWADAWTEVGECFKEVGRDFRDAFRRRA